MDSIAGLIQPEPPPGLPVLARFLAPLPAGVVTWCIGSFTQAEELVVNPFCRTIATATEAVRLGRRAVLSDTNPLTVFVLRTLLSLPSQRELTGALQRLSDTLKGDVPLRGHLRQLYAVTCAHCGQSASASHFVWNRQLDRPVQKAYRCATCRQERLEPVSEAEIEMQKGVEGRGFHFWSVVERLAPADEDLKALAIRLLELYTPRNLYALATLLAKTESTFDAPPLLNAFRLAILDCLDRCSSLMPAGKRPASRSSLRPPAQYLEVNVWEAFDESVKALADFGERLAADLPDLRLVDDLEEVAPRLLTLWSAPGRRPGTPVMVRRSSARRLGEDLPAASTALVVAEPPPLVQGSYPALSWLWSGWLLGKEAAAAFQPESLLHPRRSDDWPWYLQAMSATFAGLTHAVMPNGRVALTFEESDPARLRALTLALCGSGLRPEQIQYQPLASADPLGAPPFGGTAGRFLLIFRKELTGRAETSAVDLAALSARMRGAVLQAARETLAQRAQPSPFAWINNAICLRLASEGMLAELMAVKGDDFSPLACLDEQVHAALDKGLRGDLIQVASEQTPGAAQDETGEAGESAAGEAKGGDVPVQGEPAGRSRVSWWLRRPRTDVAPIADQVEETAYNMLGMSSTFTTRQITRAIFDSFQGPRVPEPGLVEAVVESYSLDLDDGQRTLRPDDNLEQRTQEHVGLVCLLVEIGHQLGYSAWISREEQKRRTPQGMLGGLLSVDERYVSPVPRHLRSDHVVEADVIWYGKGDEMFVFEVEWTARLHAALVGRRSELPGLRRFLVIPEERVGLIQFKIARSLLWSQAIAKDNWSFVKSVHLRRFAADQPSLEGFCEIVGLEPPAERHGLQLKLW